MTRRVAEADRRLAPKPRRRRGEAPGSVPHPLVTVEPSRNRSDSGSSRAEAPDAWVQIGRVSREIGLAGFVRVKLATDFEERLQVGRTVRARYPGRVDRAAADDLPLLEVVAGRPAIGDWIEVRFAGCDDRESAAALRGVELLIPLSDRRPLPADRFYPDELAGMAVLEPDEQSIGVVRALDVEPPTPVLVIETAVAGELLVPFRREFIASVDRQTRRIRLVRWSIDLKPA